MNVKCQLWGAPGGCSMGIWKPVKGRLWFPHPQKEARRVGVRQKVSRGNTVQKDENPGEARGRDTDMVSMQVIENELEGQKRGSETRGQVGGRCQARWARWAGRARLEVLVSTLRAMRCHPWTVIKGVHNQVKFVEGSLWPSRGRSISGDWRAREHKMIKLVSST